MKIRNLIATAVVALSVVITTTPVAARETKFASWKFKGRYYAQITKVVKIRRRVDCDVVRIMNANGQLYEFTTYKGDFERGDCVAVVMDTRGTKKVLDDWVVAAKYDRPDLIQQGSPNHQTEKGK